MHALLSANGAPQRQAKVRLVGQFAWRAVAAAFLASVTGGLVWSVLATALAVLLRDPGLQSPVSQVLRAIPWLFVYAAFWASFIVVAAIPPYTLLFALWMTLRLRHAGVDDTPTRRALIAFLLALPPALLLAAFNWAEAAAIFPLALTSAWVGCALSVGRLRRRTVDAPPRSTRHAP